MTSPFSVPVPPTPPREVRLTLKTRDEDICEAIRTAGGYWLRSVYDYDDKLFVVSGVLTASTLVFAYCGDGDDEYYVSLREPGEVEDTKSEFLFVTQTAQRGFYTWVDRLQKDLRTNYAGTQR